MKLYRATNEAGVNRIIEEKDIPKAQEASDFLVNAALKVGKTPEEAEKYRIKIVPEEQYEQRSQKG